MNDIFTSARQALETALTGAGLSERDCLSVRIARRGAFYEIAVATLFQRYEFYVDAGSGELAGLNAEPLPASEAVFELADEPFALSFAA